MTGSKDNFHQCVPNYSVHSHSEHINTDDQHRINKQAKLMQHYYEHDQDKMTASEI